MTTHSRHVTLVLILAVVLLLIATVVAHVVQ